MLEHSKYHVIIEWNCNKAIKSELISVKYDKWQMSENCPIWNFKYHKMLIIFIKSFVITYLTRFVWKCIKEQQIRRFTHTSGIQNMLPFTNLLYILGTDNRWNWTSLDVVIGSHWYLLVVINFYCMTVNNTQYKSLKLNATFKL